MNNQRASHLKKRLSAGEITAGIWVQLPSPVSFEVIADGGFDWVVVDSEHSTYNRETLLHMLMAFKASETAALIRVPWNEPVVVKQMLDMGFDGIMFPGIGTVEDVKLAVSACRYPPLGRRGFGPIRISGYSGAGQVEYAKGANDAVICALQIENVSAAQEIQQILKVPGIDWIMFGPNDLSGTAGCFLDTSCPEVQQAIRAMQEAAKAAGIPYAGSTGSLEAVEAGLKDGCQLMFMGDDISFLQSGMANALKMFHQVVSRIMK